MQEPVTRIRGLVCVGGHLASLSLRFLSGQGHIVVTLLKGGCEQETTLIVTHRNAGKTALHMESPVIIEED